MAVSKTRATKTAGSKPTKTTKAPAPAAASKEDLAKLGDVVASLTKEVASLKQQLADSQKAPAASNGDVVEVLKAWASSSNPLPERLVKLFRRANL